MLVASSELALLAGDFVAAVAEEFAVEAEGPVVLD